eukprot:7516942-Pyramimonas_sp.AAC.1
MKDALFTQSANVEGILETETQPTSTTTRPVHGGEPAPPLLDHGRYLSRPQRLLTPTRPGMPTWKVWPWTRYTNIYKEYRVPDGHQARKWVYAAGARKAAVECGTDLFTPKVFQEHAANVAAAVLEELHARVEHNCSSRRPRRGARKILDCRWVRKWIGAR